MLEVTLSVRLGLVGPVLSQATAIGPVGVDAPMAQDRAGRYFLPFSLVRGRLRQAWEEINESIKETDENNKQLRPPITALLGPRTDEQQSSGAIRYELRRGRLRFTDFYEEEGQSHAATLRYRIRMDSERGAADEGALQTIESRYAPGQRVWFAGKIRYEASDKTQAKCIEEHITRGLRWVTSFGAERTSGFGRLEAVVVHATSCAISVPSQTTLPDIPTTFAIALRFLEPFCVSKRPIAPNLFESDSILSGGVLRGTIAALVKRLSGLSHDGEITSGIAPPWQELGEHFNAICFSHAFPAVGESSERPVTLPLSLVKDAAEAKKYDVALCPGPGLLGDPPEAPTFAIDWKKQDKIEARFGWVRPHRELRVRTAMDRQRRRAAERQLFAYDMVCPTADIFGPNKEEPITTEVLWLAKVDLHKIQDKAARLAVAEQLRTLLRHGLDGIGKTKARAEVILDVSERSKFSSTSAPINDNLWVVTLQTPALLYDPYRLAEASDQGTLFDAYQSAWDDISGGTVQLVRFFASQSLIGGYQVRRFQPGKPYNPFVLTDAGSVFVLQAVGDVPRAQQKIHTWLQEGLSLPVWSKERYGTTWKTCPFLPQDGFGEIAVNLPCHLDWQPKEGEFHAL